LGYRASGIAPAQSRIAHSNISPTWVSVLPVAFRFLVEVVLATVIVLVADMLLLLTY
jgi:hypothetical protein